MRISDRDFITAGAEIESARRVLILLHGRGAAAESILSLAQEFDLENTAAIAPQGKNNTWYPYSFMAPLEQNQPFLDIALGRIESIITGLIAEGIPSQKIALLGFSQGACLTAEYIFRHSRHYGAVAILSGALIGNGPTLPTQSEGQSRLLQGTSVFLGGSDPDLHVPFSRIQESAKIFQAMSAEVDVRRYAGMPHSINEEEISICTQLLEKI